MLGKSFLLRSGHIGGCRRPAVPRQSHQRRLQIRVQIALQCTGHIVVGHGPHPETTTVDDGAALERIFTQRILVISPSIAEHSNGSAPGGIRPRPDHKVRLACNRHTVIRPHLPLGLHLVTLSPHFQHIARLAMNHITHQPDLGAGTHSTQPLEAFDEAGLQHRVEMGVDVNLRDGWHTLQLIECAHQLTEHVSGTVPGHQLHVASQPVLKQAAVTTVFLGVVVAPAGRHRLQSQLQHLGQRTRIVRQKLVQITRATRYRVVQHHIVAARSAVFARLILQCHAQVIHLATKAFFQAQLHGRHEGLHHAIIHPVFGVRHQHAQRLRFKLAVQVQALQQVGRVFTVALGAVKSVNLLARIAVAPGRLLNLATVPAQPEAGPGGLLVGHLECLSRLGQLTKVHISEHDPGNELKAKRHIPGRNAPCLADVLLGKVGHQLAYVIFWLPVFHAVVNPYLGIVAVGDRLPEAQQGAALGGI